METVVYNFHKYIIVSQATVVVLLPFLLWHVTTLSRFVPLVVVQVFAGILLGPSILGALAPDVFAAFFSADLLKGVQGLALIAVCLFAFVAGTEADKEMISGAGKAVLSIGLGGLLITWAAGVGAGFLVAQTFPAALGSSGNVLVFAAAFGLCNAVPALPVLAALLRELDLVRRRVGAMALAAAGLGDLILWGGVAVLLPLAKGGDVFTSFGIAVAGGVVTLLVIVRGANPYFEHLLATQASERVIMIFVAVTTFFCATITALTGLHPVIGAFMAGMFLPDKIRHLAADKLDMPTAMILMPFFFLNTGLTTNFSVNDPVIWTIFLISFIVCVLAKVAGTAVMARAVGENWAFGATAGVLLQTKGLMEIVVVTIFVNANLISQTTYSALVFVALVSTALTMPLTTLMLSFFGKQVEASGRRTPAPSGAAPATAS